MSATVDNSLRKLNDCGCCEGIAVQTPSQVYNRPGLKAIAYRVGVHEQFKETMLARLSSTKLPAMGLKTHEDDDFSIALLDSWAAVCDVLTFYQERIANESYLRTATERRSIMELARTIGYELSPGVAANAYLAFEVDESPGSPHQITIDKGIKVQSTPGPGEQPQTFETIESIEARAEWNAIKPRIMQPQIIPNNLIPETLLLNGTSTNLKPGDTILILANNSGRTLRVMDVVVDQQSKTTYIALVRFPKGPQWYEDKQFPHGDFDVDKAKLSGYLIQDRVLEKSWNAVDLEAYISAQEWNKNDLIDIVRSELHYRPRFADNAMVFAMRQSAALFGYNAPRYNSLMPAQRYDDHYIIYSIDNNHNIKIEKCYQAIYKKNNGYIIFDYWGEINPDYPKNWEGWTLQDYLDYTGEKFRIYLDGIYNNILKDSWIVLENGTDSNHYQVSEVAEVTHSDFAINAKVIRLDLYGGEFFDKFKIRGTTVLIQSQQLDLAEVPIPDAISGDSILLNDFYLGLRAGQVVAITGESYDLIGVKLTEIAIISDVMIDGGFTKLIFQRKLINQYVRDTVTICANVVLATHGETVGEVLGSGNASQSYQSFVLKQSPLTYISSQTPSGSETSLQVRVNDLLWHEVPTLYSRGPKDHVYVTRIDDDGKTTVQFGDGNKGARLPSGQNNISAIYRKGIGLGGLVKAGQLSLLMSRPLGLKGAVNPLPSSGAQDRQSLSDARRNAPLTVLILGRAVSLQDYEDFARAFAGVAKAMATWTWDGEKRAVLVTVAGPKGNVIKKDDITYQNLLSSMRKFGDPYVPLMVSSYRPVSFKISASVKVNPEYQQDRVFALLDQKLRDYFSFEFRNFGQAVTLSEVIAVMQNVPGVFAVSIKDNDLYRTDGLGQPGKILEAAMPKPGDKTVVEAELITLDSAPIDLKVMT